MTEAERDIIYWLTRIVNGEGTASDNWREVRLAWRRSIESDQY